MEERQTVEDGKIAFEPAGRQGLDVNDHDIIIEPSRHGAPTMSNGGAVWKTRRGRRAVRC